MCEMSQDLLHMCMEACWAGMEHPCVACNACMRAPCCMHLHKLLITDN